VPYNAFLSVDIFGYVCWNLNDTYIRQKLEAIATADYISPMLYPSGFQYGDSRISCSRGSSFRDSQLSLERARERTCAGPLRFRPWLQGLSGLRV